MFSIFQKHRYTDVDIDVSPNTVLLQEGVVARSVKNFEPVQRVSFFLILFGEIGIPYFLHMDTPPPQRNLIFVIKYARLKSQNCVRDFLFSNQNRLVLVL